MKLKNYSFILFLLVSTVFSNRVDAGRVRNGIKLSNNEYTCKSLRQSILLADGGCNHATGKSVQERCEMCSHGKDKIREANRKGCNLKNVEDQVESLNDTYSALCRNLGTGGANNIPETQSDGSFKWRR